MQKFVWGWVIMHHSIGGADMETHEKPAAPSIKDAQAEIQRIREDAKKKKASQPKEGQSQSA